MNIRPLNDLIVVERIMPENPATASGILLPPSEEAQDSPYMGRVLEVGPGRPAKLSGIAEHLLSAVRVVHEQVATDLDERSDAALEALGKALWEYDQTSPIIPMTVKPGDVIIYSRHGHQHFRIGGRDLVVFAENSVIGIVEE